MDRRNYIYQHYKTTAENFGLSGRCTIQDPIIRDKEIQFLKKEIQTFINTHERNPVVMDIGCGNGYTLEVLANFFPKLHFIGLEPHPDLFQLSLKRKGERKLQNVIFQNKSILEETLIEYPVDIIFTERVLINLIDDKEQENAIGNISKHLNKGGEYLMIESFVEPLQKLNKLRRENLLGDPIEESKHNKFLKFSFLRKLTKYQLFSAPIDDLDGLTPHFFLGRVFHPYSRQEGSKMKENLLLEVLEKSELFHQLKEEYISPIQFFKFKKNYN